MEILNFSPEQFKIFLLILVRVSVVIYLFPVFGSRLFPALPKAGFAMVVSMGLIGNVHVKAGIFPDSIPQLVVMIVSELIVGMILSLVVRMFFAAVQLAGQIISFQMGFSVINVLDPQTGTQVSILDQIGFWVVLLVFLLLNGHHILISCLAKSFKLVDVGMISMKHGLFKEILSLSSDMFILGIKIGAPAIVSLLFVSAAFGLCAKFAPQMNILIAAFPVKIVVGLAFFGITLEIVLVMTRIYVENLGGLFLTILAWLGAG